jgi:hypothetical protein
VKSLALGRRQDSQGSRVSAYLWLRRSRSSSLRPS